MDRYWPKLIFAVMIASLKLTAAPQAPNGSSEIASILTRIGARIQQYFARAQTILCDEQVHIHAFGYASSTVGDDRNLAYELRIAWEEASGANFIPEATVLRQIRTINGRKVQPDEDPGCLDPQPVSPEPLSIFLPRRREGYTFSPGSMRREAGRQALTLDYRPVEPHADEIAWTANCVSVSLPGRTAGRVWADAETGEVLRLDERLIGMFEFPVPAAHRLLNGPWAMAIERANSSIRYRPVTFRNPDETLMLPYSIETLNFWRGGSTPRVLTTQRLSNCRRFLTEARVREPGAR